jgi:hypothetical protein
MAWMDLKIALAPLRVKIELWYLLPVFFINMSKATVLSEGERNQTYIGLTAGTFNKRFDGHTSTIRNEELNGTTLSSYIWKLKN